MTTSDCPICWQPHDPNAFVTPIPCGHKNGHVFCLACFNGWPRLNRTCPACLSPLSRVLHSDGREENITDEWMSYVVFVGVQVLVSVAKMSFRMVMLVVACVLLAYSLAFLVAIGLWTTKPVIPPPPASLVDIVNCTVAIYVYHLPFTVNDSNACVYIQRDLEHTENCTDGEPAIRVRGLNVAIAFNHHTIVLGNGACGVVVHGERDHNYTRTPTTTITNARFVTRDSSRTIAFYVGAFSRLIIYNATTENVRRVFYAEDDSRVVSYGGVSRWSDPNATHAYGHYYANPGGHANGEFFSPTIEYFRPRDPTIESISNDMWLWYQSQCGVDSAWGREE
jgi:hypothetical protein